MHTNTKGTPNMSATRINLLNSDLSSASARSGRWLDQLDSEDRAELEAFSAWFEPQTTKNVVASYRSNLAKAWCDQKLTSDMKSALKKYAEFVEQQ